ncbi:early light-induced protein 1, chloroplastic-like isoform X1 [Pyrus x bretschneideri]|uniref:early light-induced protein 1, chloroplastic-like isoform X1 n=1 Tax=Pyrus x bretschneideri TaxID=225117 RepID=UPI00202F0E85|nr:early light-induced protein 1, chloroplastic-like isoform X1 [Pyrus x bretschneideri]
MAASATFMHSTFLANSLAYGAGKNKSVRVNQLVAPTVHIYPQIRICSMAKDGRKKQPSIVTNASKNPPPPPPTPSSPSKQVGTKFSDLFAFSGPVPERINGRLAMVGFVSALAVELSKGQDVFAQISNGGVSLFLGTSILITVASLIPLFNGLSVESESDGIMTPDAELINGRLAMLGLVALAFTEYVKGGTLV